MTKAIAVKEVYAIMDPTVNVGEIIEANMGEGGISPSLLSRVKVPSGGGTMWTVETLEGEAAVKEIEGIIIHSQKIRVYWEVGMDEGGGGTAPDCSSTDAITGTGNPGGRCLKCPLAQFGSAKKGDGQACSMRTMLFVVVPDEIFPIVISVPPASLKACDQYLMRLTSKRVRKTDVYTKIGLEKATNSANISYARMTFSVSGMVADEQKAVITEYVAAMLPSLKNASFDEDQPPE